MTVTISLEEFEAMVKEIQLLRDEKEELLKANKFLNEQIKEYNEKYGDKK